MGICASCLGLSSGNVANEEPEETSHLLPNPQQVADYGASTNAETVEPLVIDMQDALEERQEAAEKARLSSVWKGISDKLIDISLLHANPHNHDPNSKNKDESDSAYGTQASIDYERLFRDTLPRKPYPNYRPAIQQDTFTPPKTPNDDDKEPVNEQQWLRDIINRNPNDKSWDPNTVHKIGRPLLVNFDDVLARDQN